MQTYGFRTAYHHKSHTSGKYLHYGLRGVVERSERHRYVGRYGRYAKYRYAYFHRRVVCAYASLHWYELGQPSDCHKVQYVRRGQRRRFPECVAHEKYHKVIHEPYQYRVAHESPFSGQARHCLYPFGHAGYEIGYAVVKYRMAELFAEHVYYKYTGRQYAQKYVFIIHRRWSRPCVFAYGYQFVCESFDIVVLEHEREQNAQGEHYHVYRSFQYHRAQEFAHRYSFGLVHGGAAGHFTCARHYQVRYVRHGDRIYRVCDRYVPVAHCFERYEPSYPYQHECGVSGYERKGHVEIIGLFDRRPYAGQIES